MFQDSQQGGNRLGGFAGTITGVFHGTRQFLLYAVVVVALALLGASSAWAQDGGDAGGDGDRQQDPPAQEDPTVPTPTFEGIAEQLLKIENLTKFEEENAELRQANRSLRDENNALKREINELTKRIQELTQSIETQSERLRQQLLSIPEFTVRSKLVGSERSSAILDFGGKLVRIRSDLQGVNVPANDGIMTLIDVREISRDVIVLYFSELDREITIFD